MKYIYISKLCKGTLCTCLVNISNINHHRNNGTQNFITRLASANSPRSRYNPLEYSSSKAQFATRKCTNTCCGAGFSRVDTERRYVSFRLTSMRERVTRVNLLSEFNARKWWFMRFRASLMRSLRTAWMTGLCNKSCKRAQ